MVFRTCFSLALVCLASLTINYVAAFEDVAGSNIQAFEATTSANVGAVTAEDPSTLKGNTASNDYVGAVVEEGSRQPVSTADTDSDISVGFVVPEDNSRLQQLMSSEARSAGPPTLLYGSANLMRREPAPPVLMEVLDTGDVEELIEIPDGQEEEYFATAGDAVDSSIQWGSDTLSPQQEVQRDEEDARIDKAGLVVEIRDPSLKSTAPPPIEVPLAEVKGVLSVRGWDIYDQSTTDRLAAIKNEAAHANLRR